MQRAPRENGCGDRSPPPGMANRTICRLAAPGGPRRFSPVATFLRLILEAYPAGLALLTGLRGLAGEGKCAYRVMSLCSLQAPRLREFLGRAFTGPEDLGLTPSVRLDQR